MAEQANNVPDAEKATGPWEWRSEGYNDGSGPIVVKRTEHGDVEIWQGNDWIGISEVNVKQLAHNLMAAAEQGDKP